MADFEKILNDHKGEDGSIPASAIGAAVAAIKTAVGNEYVEKERYKAKLTEIDALKERQQTAEDNATTAEKWKTKYEALKDEFSEYKKAEAAKVTLSEKQDAYRALLKAEGISEKRIESIVRVTDFTNVTVKDGKLENEESLRSSINEEWSDFKVSLDTKGAHVSTPPDSAKSAGVKTRDEIMEIKDAEERQAAWAEFLNAQKS